MTGKYIVKETTYLEEVKNSLELALAEMGNEVLDMSIEVELL